MVFEAFFLNCYKTDLYSLCYGFLELIKFFSISVDCIKYWTFSIYDADFNNVQRVFAWVLNCF